MILNCSFRYIVFNEDRLYTCIVDSSRFNQRGVKIKQFRGKHFENKTFRDVQAIWFENCCVNYIPRGIHDNFPNLIAFGVLNCDLLQVLREDIEEMEDLKFFYLHANNLQSLPDDLFVNLKNLKEISIINNASLQYMSSKIIGNIIRNGLEYVDLSYNGCIDAHYCPDYVDSTSSVQELMRIIDEKCNVGDSCKKQQKFCMKSSIAPKAKREEEQQLDCFFVIDDQSFSFRKSSLKSQSPVFSKLIDKEPNANEVVLRGFQPATVADFVEFINTGRMKSGANVFELFILANQFMISTLKTICEENIAKNIDLFDCPKVYSLAMRFKSKKLKDCVVAKLNEKRDVKIIGNRLQEVMKALRVCSTKIKEAKETYVREVKEAEAKFEQVLKELN